MSWLASRSGWSPGAGMCMHPSSSRWGWVVPHQACAGVMVAGVAQRLACILQGLHGLCMLCWPLCTMSMAPAPPGCEGVNQPGAVSTVCMQARVPACQHRRCWQLTHAAVNGRQHTCKDQLTRGTLGCCPCCRRSVQVSIRPWDTSTVMPGDSSSPAAAQPAGMAGGWAAMLVGTAVNCTEARVWVPAGRATSTPAQWPK